MIKFCAENLAPYKVPKQIEFRSELPKTMVGKVLRRVLVEEEKKKLGEVTRRHGDTVRLPVSQSLRSG